MLSFGKMLHSQLCQTFIFVVTDMVTELSISFQLSAPTFAVKLQSPMRWSVERQAEEASDVEGSWNQPWGSKPLVGF